MHKQHDRTRLTGFLALFCLWMLIFMPEFHNKKWKIIRKFYNSKEIDKIISLPAAGTSIRQCREMGLDIIPLKLRLIRLELISYRP
jgi:hypothetical protein